MWYVLVTQKEGFVEELIERLKDERKKSSGVRGLVSKIYQLLIKRELNKQFSRENERVLIQIEEKLLELSEIMNEPDLVLLEKAIFELSTQNARKIL